MTIRCLVGAFTMMEN